MNQTPAIPSLSQNLRIVIFKACIVAAWSNKNMAADQMRYLSHLIETLSTNSEDRDVLRKLRVKELNEGQVLSEIEQFSNDEKDG